MMEKEKSNFNRRQFLKRSIQVASISIVPRYVLGGIGYTAPSDVINLGFIGTGKQGKGLGGRFMKIQDCRIVANAEVDSKKKESFAGYIETFYSDTIGKSEVTQYVEYKDLLSRDDIDAVVIATPDHWHALNAINSLQAGKDVFCEKPMAHTVWEGRRMVEVTRENNRVFQTGSMQRSSFNFRRACELVRNGIIGDVKHIKVSVGDPAIYCDLPEEPTPDYLDWERWVGPAAMRAYNEILSPPIEQTHFPHWRKYWEFGGGGVTDWGAHMYDIAQWALGMDDSGPIEFIPPKEEGANRGMKMKYANGTTMTHEDFDRGYGVEFIGSDGTIRVSRSFLEADPANILEASIPANGEHLYHSVNHYQDWIDAIKNRTKPICDVEIGHRTGTICNINNIAYTLKSDLKWNPKSEEITGDKKAVKMLSKKYRKPYVVD